MSMPSYRLYHIDGLGSFTAAEWIMAENDIWATHAAHHLRRSIKCEVWQGSRMIADVETENRQSMPH
jgi:hypothetical protein